MVEKRVEELRPWGVNVPFIVLGLAYFLAGGLSLWKNSQDHGYLMMVGAYALYEGMITRLFFPATKYFKLQALTLISLAVPLPEAQALSSYALTFLELRALRDVKSYGSRFPVNALVLASLALSILALVPTIAPEPKGDLLRFFKVASPRDHRDANSSST